MGGEMRVLILEEGTDAEQVSVLAGYLRMELLQLDIENVAAIEAGAPPPGTRSGNGIPVAAGLLVAFG
jgi:hypothetical protein